MFLVELILIKRLGQKPHKITITKKNKRHSKIMKPRVNYENFYVTSLRFIILNRFAKMKWKPLGIHLPIIPNPLHHGSPSFALSI